MNVKDVQDHTLSPKEAAEGMPHGSGLLVFCIGGKNVLHTWLESPEPTRVLRQPPKSSPLPGEEHGSFRPTRQLE